ncbi:MAG: hypothetical protein WCB74_00500, partial [Pseudolabrys sp.]
LDAVYLAARQIHGEMRNVQATGAIDEDKTAIWRSMMLSAGRRSCRSGVVNNAGINIAVS